MDDFSLSTAYLGTVNIGQCREGSSKAVPACFLFVLQPPSSSGGQPEAVPVACIIWYPLGLAQREVICTWHLDLLERCLKTYSFGLQRGLSFKGMCCT